MNLEGLEVLTLQIKRDSFKKILKGEQKVEHRFVYPRNAKQYLVEKDNGLVLERYDAPEEGDFISGYTLVFANAAGDELAVYATLAENSESATFGYMDGDKVNKVDVKEMDDALMIEYPEYTALFMRKALEKPISYVFPLGMIREEDDPVNEYDGIIYRVTSTAIVGDKILSFLSF